MGAMVACYVFPSIMTVELNDKERSSVFIKLLFHLLEYRAEDLAGTELDGTGAKIILNYFIYNAGVVIIYL